MKILSIGNSFSTDAQRYIHKMSVLNSNPIKTVNLYIGGCPLRKHYFNMLENSKSYAFEFNGEGTGIFVTIKDALMSDAWDIVTMQQASFYSPNWESYEPYLSELSAYVKKYAPQAKQVIHQTWSYSDEAVVKSGVGESHDEMFERIKPAYKKAAKLIDASVVIPSGELMSLLIKNGIEFPYTQDGHHASRGAGRLAIGLLWYCLFTKSDPMTVILPETDIPVTSEEIKIIRESVNAVL